MTEMNGFFLVLFRSLKWGLVVARCMEVGDGRFVVNAMRTHDICTTDQLRFGRFQFNFISLLPPR